MADDDILSRYYGRPQPDPGADEVYDTSDVLRSMRPISAPARAAQSASAAIPANTEHNWSLLNMLKGAMARGWLDWQGRPARGDSFSPQDVLAPTGGMAFGSAPMGALAAGAARREAQMTMDQASRTPFKADAFHGTDRGLNGRRFSDDEANRTWYDNPNFADVHVEDPAGGVWLTSSPKEAGAYAKAAMRLNKGDPAQSGANIIPAEVRFKNPYMHPAEEMANEGISSLPSPYALAEQGYDGAVIPRNADWRTKPEFERTDAQMRAMDKAEFDHWVRNHLTVDPGDLSHYVALKPGTVFSKLTGEQLYAAPGLPLPAAPQQDDWLSLLRHYYGSNR